MTFKIFYFLLILIIPNTLFSLKLSNINFPILDLGFNLTNLGFGSRGCIGLEKENYFLGFRMQNTSEFQLFPKKLPLDNTLDFNLLLGVSANNPFGYASWRSGISLIKFDRRGDFDHLINTHYANPDSVFSQKVSYKIGWPMELLAVLKYHYIGIGFNLFINYNKKEIYYGFGIIGLFGNWSYK